MEFYYMISVATRLEPIILLISVATRLESILSLLQRHTELPRLADELAMGQV